MSAHIIDGKAIAKDKIASLKVKIEESNITPGLAMVLVGDDPASQIYVKKKTKWCKKVGITPYDKKLPEHIGQHELDCIIENLNKDDNVDGILVQLPLPEHINSNFIIEQVDPMKDVDGFHPLNLGRIMWGNPYLIPCTPSGIMDIIDRFATNLTGANVLMVGMSIIIGKPLFHMLLNKNATIITAHKYTKNLPELVSQADVLITAVGIPSLIKGKWIKENAIVVDVGISRVGNKVCGDVEFDVAAERAWAITPVPGGIGPMTVAVLMENTYKAALERRKRWL
jgi:methylenetetrahydrofolate dehydrogenase (NADP+)/methenyltetrahydrofolate cyclohydrolase